jgi:hypothetical protein
MKPSYDASRPALAGRWDRRDNRAGQPDPGCYAMRLVPRGLHVPCRIVRAHDLWFAIIDEVEKPRTIDPEANEFVMRVWHHGRRMSEGDYSFALSVKRWAREHQPEHPALHPHRAVSLASLPPVVP